ncbi:LapD/MoxY N-terminal periplasmic domain-containing protein, partial [Rhodoferax sp.]|uniref:EAL domain-containing protein n=1 Tax=Rhodoferax sp. TaxID=50421 RepID=UPI001A09E6EF
MSLIKQLWIAITLVMTIAFGGSMVVSVLSARHYLEQQLQVKNIDNANALALSLTQLEKDEVMVGLLVAAQFDVGHYRFIRIVSPTGQTLVERVAADLKPGAPDWFVKLIPIRTAPGQALVQDGWNQYGTLTLASHDSYAYQSLWDGTIELLLWFVIGAAITGMVGTVLIRIITRPLGKVVGQAQAIAERRFLTITEPRTPEFKSVAHAMNEMVGRLKAMFNDEAARLEAMRQKVNHDAVTGLPGRDYFLSQLHEAVQGDRFGSTGTLVLVRLPDLDNLNAQLGRQQTDALLKHMAEELDKNSGEHPGRQAGRLKGAELAVVCPGVTTAVELASDIHERLVQNLLPKWRDRVPDLFHIGAVRYRHHQNISELLARADETLAQAASQGPNSWHAGEDSTAKAALPAAQWRALLTEAVADGRLALSFYPVMSCDGTNPLHQEGMIRLQVDAAGTLLSAGDFMPMAAQLNLTAPIDLGVVKLAIEHLRSTAGDIAVNLSAATVANFSFRHELTQLLTAHPEACQRLLIEVPEYGVFKQFDAFRDLAHQLKQLGCRVGVEYFGQSFSESGKLADLGLDYIKVHPSYIRDIASNAGNQEFLKGLCKVAHAIGITVVAQG